MKALINLGQELFQLKQENEALKANNVALEQRLVDNEDNVVSTMEACCELYEMLLLASPATLNNEAKEVKSTMVAVYATLILKGKKRLSQVPAALRPQVEVMLKELLDVEELPEELL